MLNNQPVKQEVMDTMKKALEFWGPDAQGMWRQGAAGLGNLLLYNTPEAVFEKMPFGDSSDNFVFTAGARIDNRAELCRIFKIAPMEAFKLPDSYFIMRAYQRWGENCADHLLGDWAFAVWDKAKQRLFVARDHHGVTAMYYYKGEDFFVFSSSLKGILSLPEVEKKVNDYKVAQILVGWNEGGPETCYQNIFRLPPAHTLSLHNGTLSVNRYWFLEQTPELRLKEEQQYIDLFLDIYTEAVKCRLRSYRPVGATLSGGLDSGSVCALASRELKKEGKRLPAYTAVPLYDTTGLVPPNRIGDEGPLAQAVADFCGNIDITFCKAENISPLEGVERMLELHDEPIIAVGNSYWIIDILDMAKCDKLGAVLLGQGGNYTVSWPFPYFCNTLKKAKHNIFQLLKKIAKRNIFNIYTRYFNGVLIKNILFNKELTDRIKFFNKLNSFRSCSYKSIKEAQLKSIQSGKSKTGALLFENGSAYKLEFRDPTFDKRVLSFIASFDFPESEPRYFIKNGFKDLLPYSIINNSMLGYQSSDLLFRVRNNSQDYENHIFEISNMPQFYDIINYKKTNNWMKNIDFICFNLRPIMVKEFLKKRIYLNYN